MPTETNHEASRSAAIRGLAVVGFIALIGLGMWLAIYSARYVPSAVSHLNSAAVSVASIFHGNGPTLEVVPTGTSTPDTNTATTTATSTTATSTQPKPSTGTGTGTHTGTPENHVYPVGTSTPSSTTAPLSGLPDLVISVTDVGYLATLSTDSYVSSTTTIARGMRPAVKFTVRNVGTNLMQSGWRFTAYLPTLSNYLFQSAPQQALYPGDSIDYTLGFDQPLSGTQTITITANSDNYGESTTANNIAKAIVTIGS